MRYVRYLDTRNIPSSLIEDILELSKEMIKDLGIYISQVDLYRVWRNFSYDMKCSWVPIDFQPDGESREEFLLNVIFHYCEEIDPQNLT